MLTFLGGEFVKMHVGPECSAHFVPNPWEQKKTTGKQKKWRATNNHIFWPGHFKDPWDVLTPTGGIIRLLISGRGPPCKIHGIDISTYGLWVFV